MSNLYLTNYPQGIREDAELYWTQMKLAINSNDFSNPFLYKWLFYQELQTYFTSLFCVKDNTGEKLRSYQNTFFKYLWQYGEIVVTYNNNILYLWQVQEKFNKGIHIDKVKVNLIQENTQTFNQNSKSIILKNNVNCVYVSWDNYNQSAIFKYWPYINKQYDMYKIFENACVLDSKKFVIDLNNDNNELSKLEKETILNPLEPVIYIHTPLGDNDSGQQNILKEITKGNSTSQLSYDNLVNFKKYWKDVFGMVNAVESNQDRTNLGQTIAQHYGSENSENLILRNLKDFALRFNKLYNDNLEFIETSNVNVIDNDNNIKTAKGVDYNDN